MKRILLLISFITVFYFGISAQNKLSFQFKNTPIVAALTEIEKQNGFTFSYNPELLKNFPNVTAQFQNSSLKNVLAVLFDRTDIQYLINERYIILKKRPKATKHRTISGYIYDRETTETLIGANISDPKSGNATVSNNYGFYSLTVPDEITDLQASYIGYGTHSFQIEDDEKGPFNIFLKPSLALDTLVVEGSRVTNLRSTDIGKLSMNASELKSVPSFMGESDLVKTLQLTPGVTAGTEGIAGMYVRGGNLDENLYLVDGNPVYHVNHMLGIFSTFNTDAVKLMNFYKGSFPARFGGRLSSVVDMRMNDGDSKKIGGTVSVGLLSSRLNLNGPLFSDKTTFNVSLRRTYFDLFTTPLIALINYSNNKGGNDNYSDKMSMNYNFYDLNGKISHKFSDRSRLFLSIYAGNDKMSGHYTVDSKENRNEPSEYNTTPYFIDNNSDQKVKIAWGTKLASLNWAYQLNSKLYSSSTLIFSQYNSDISSSEKEAYSYAPKPETGLTEKKEAFSKSSVYGSGITDVGARTDFDYTPDHNHYIRYGATLINHFFRPEHTRVGALEDNNGNKLEKEFTYANDSVNVLETSLYAEDEMDISDKIKLNLGVHLSNFNVEKKNYLSLQPRVSGRYLLSETLSFKASYAQMSQYLHLLQSSFLSLPNDLWMPVTANVKPLVSHQLSGGVYWDYRKINFSMEGYYKTSKNQMEYKEGAELFSVGKNWEERVAQGNGKAYGVEWMAAKKQGKTTGWAGYALSWATRHFPNGEINGGKPYYAKFDNRHKINIVVNHKFNRKVDVNASWFLATGNWLTLPLEKYSSSSYPQYYYSERNNYKMPPYHRLDLSINFTKQKKKGTRIWNVSIYNSYFQKNAFMVLPETVNYYEESNKWGSVNRTESEYRKITIFPIIPSVSYTYKF